MEMSWVFFALLASLLAAGSSIVEKKNLMHQHAAEFSTSMSIILLVLTLPLWLLAEVEKLTPGSIGFIYIASLLGALAFLFLAKAMRHAAISYTAPFLVFEPLFVVLIAAFLLGDKLSLLQLAGIGILMAGAYIINSHEHHDLLSPLKHMFKSKYNLFIFAALLLYGISSVLDKRILGVAADGGMGVPVLTFLPLVSFFTAVNFMLIMILFYDGIHGIGKDIGHNFRWILPVAMLTLGYRLSQAYAISFPGVMISLIIPIKRLSSLFATVIGGELFHEKNILRKTLACAVMIIGAVMIVI